MKEAEECLTFLLQKAREIYSLELFIELKADLKGSRLIGQCRKIAPYRYLIRLHAKLLADFGAVYIKDVLTHEFAHAVQMQLYPRSKPHSKEWREIFKTLGGAKSKINYRPQKSKTYKTYLYKCSCREHILSSIRHNRAFKSRVYYICKKCKERLVFDKPL